MFGRERHDDVNATVRAPSVAIPGLGMTPSTESRRSRMRSAVGLAQATAVKCIATIKDAQRCDARSELWHGDINCIAGVEGMQRRDGRHEPLP